LKTDDIPIAVGRNQATASDAFLVLHNKGAGPLFVFGANVAAGTEGPHVELKGGEFGICCVAAVGYDSATNTAVVAGSTGEVGGPPPVIALANLTSGKVVYFNGLPGPPPFHAGFVNGLAVDSDDGIACTTTELDARVEFYNLQTQTGTFVTLPGQPQQINSGSDVEYDPVNKLFFVAQSVSTTGSGSSIQVYSSTGKLVESLNGFSFSNGSNVIGTHIALNPATRTGYVDGPSSNVNELQQFSY
jgi:WD40 repeat protein